MFDSNRLTIVFAGGVTAGHLFPGLAAAGQLRHSVPDAKILFVGTGRAIEHAHVSAAGFEYAVLPGRPLPRRMGELLPFVVETLAGYWAARRLLINEAAAAVVALGGYACAPTARAALRLGIPVVLLEQNVLPGKVTRWLARRAAAVCLSWAPAKRHLPTRANVFTTGNPIRPEFFQPADKENLLLVLGGSQGAHVLNTESPKALYRVRAALQGWRIVHQTGSTDQPVVERLYRRLGIAAETVPFIDDMPQMMRFARVAVSRAGGTTLAELAAAGTPAVLVPYPHAADAHQHRNAELFARAGGALIVEQTAADGDTANRSVTRSPRAGSGGAEPRRFDVALAEALGPLLIDSERLTAMGRVMRRFARPDAASRVAEVIAHYARSAAALPAAA